MFVSTRDQGAPRRRNRIYGHSDASGPRSSGFSLLSAITGASNGSGGSSSTVTQESYSRAKQSHSSQGGQSSQGSRTRRRKSRRNMDKSVKASESPKAVKVSVKPKDANLRSGLERVKPLRPIQELDLSNEVKTAKPVSDVKKDVNVFEFLVEEQKGSRPGPKTKDEPQSDSESESESGSESDSESESEVDSDAGSKPDLNMESESSSDSDSDSDSGSDTGDEAEAASPELERALVPRQPSPPDIEEPELEGYYRSQMSDSGISMGSSTGDHYLDPFAKHPLPPLIEESHDLSAYTQSMVDPYYQHEHQLWSHPPSISYGMEPVPLSPASIRSYSYPHEYAYRGTPEPPSTGESSQSCLESAPLIFRGKPKTSRPDPKVFRSFASVHSRMLLQMQSNIADLEHELNVLDARAVSAETSRKLRKGEHVDIPRHFTQDQSRRTELYQELNTSLDHYYQALSSFQQIAKITTPCDLAEARGLKSWLLSHVSPSSKVAPLIGDGTDLVRFGSARSDEISSHTLQVVAYTIFVNVFVPLLIFKIVSGVLSRLILLSLVTSASVLVMERHRSNVKVDMGNLHWHCIICCTTLCFVAALFFS